MGTSFPGVKRSGRGVNHVSRSSAEVKERIQLYLYSPCGPSRSLRGLYLYLLYFNNNFSGPNIVRATRVSGLPRETASHCPHNHVFKQYQFHICTIIQSFTEEFCIHWPQFSTRRSRKMYCNFWAIFPPSDSEFQKYVYLRNFVRRLGRVVRPAQLEAKQLETSRAADTSNSSTIAWFILR